MDLNGCWKVNFLLLFQARSVKSMNSSSLHKYIMFCLLCLITSILTISFSDGDTHVTI